MVRRSSHEAGLLNTQLSWLRNSQNHMERSVDEAPLQSKPARVKTKRCQNVVWLDGASFGPVCAQQLTPVTLCIKINVIKTTGTKNICFNFSYVKNKVSLKPKKKKKINGGP